MALKAIRPSSGKKQKKVRNLVMRSRSQGDPIDTRDQILAEEDPLGVSTAYTDKQAYMDLEFDSHGKQVTKTVPDGTKPN